MSEGFCQLADNSHVSETGTIVNNKVTYFGIDLLIP